MDISETYIKMCDCPEIQGKWVPKVGDVFCFNGKHPKLAKNPIVYKVEVGKDGVKFGNLIPTEVVRRHYKNLYIWLPRQGDLQEMVGRRFNNFVRFVDSFYGSGVDEFWVDDKELPSMEQLWLAFAMWQLHQKKWSGTKWV